jgi:hypothetical protein
MLGVFGHTAIEVQYETNRGAVLNEGVTSVGRLTIEVEQMPAAAAARHLELHE